MAVTKSLEGLRVKRELVAGPNKLKPHRKATMLASIDRQVALKELLVSREVRLGEPQPGTNITATIGLLLSAIKELANRVEQLESGR